ncbi:MAG TPA: hypothetical protein VGU01_06245 [Sphingomicrobium sp.]|nr:hypothetical protein [Sphingomicrobium sp.]
MPKSLKPVVIEWIYKSLLDPLTGRLTRSIVTQDDVVAGIDATGVDLSKNNPANFIKDVIRGHGASGMWPDYLKERRIGGRQITGDRNVFEFISYEPGQTEPFPSRFGFHENVSRHRVQSLSMPLASKQLGRDDETYLIQVAAKLAVIETHFALMSPLRIVELTHLQIGIKLRLTEVDSLYAAVLRHPDGGDEQIIITAEAKKRRQRILEEQVMQQVRAAFHATRTDLVVPIAMTAADNGIYVAEFKSVRRSALASFDMLELETEALYELRPKVPGI